MTPITLALGGNLGNVPATLSSALAVIDSMPSTAVLQISRLFATSPIGVRAGDRFMNAVAVVETAHSAVSFLQQLQSIERGLGRVRTGHWGPRTIDLDLLAWGNEVIETTLLSVPHPGCWYRRFVLDPWCDVAPDWNHPRLGENVRTMRDRLLVRPLPVAVASDDVDWNRRVEAALRDAFSPGEIDLAMLSAPSAAQAVNLTPWTAASAVRCVALGSSEEAVIQAPEILRAALDEPTPLPQQLSPR